MCPVIRVSDETYKRLEFLAEGFDTPSNVIEKLLNEKGIKMPNSSANIKEIPIIEPNLPVSAFKKMHKIEGWAKKNKQPDVGRVLQVYLDISNGNKGVLREEFIKKLQDKKIYGGDYSKISSNIAQMKEDHEKAHGKVFYDYGKKLRMHDAVYLEALKHFKTKS